jgi:galactofuranosylgalactofuranosylrhamnosyl-N-acetylglucosaminyl-diphospho-decaprenol beta-1,5/1,6-galactofuranosyltransferase
VATRNRPALLERCLGRLLAQTPPPDAVIVVDDAGDMPLAPLVGRHGPSVTLLRLPRNCGPAAAYAVAIEAALKAGADQVWLMDDDGVPAEPDCLAVPPPPHPRAAGRLSVGVTARKSGVELLHLRWVTSAPAARVGLVPEMTTFNRPEPLAAVLRRLGKDAEAVAAITAMVIVNNGNPGLAAHLEAAALPAALAGRLRVIEQGNFGGAGGFTRGLIEARGIEGATHAVLIDDDVVLEPEALSRAARFFALAEADALLGGHMLDLFRPTHLYEAGALVDSRRLVLQSLHRGLDLGTSHGLDCLLEPDPMHYNGWWFMALPLRLLDEHGWPMPCFIRGDDVAFGLRLHAAGVPTVSMSGVAIWHEPFYAKLHGWHIYYETRNMLAAAGWHVGARPSRLSYIVLKWVLADLLAYRYQRAALRLRAVRDFLDGPAIFTCDPRPVHAGLAALCRLSPLPRGARERAIPQAGP